MTAVSRAIRTPAGHFFLLGPRGTGKSTWLRSVFPGARVVDLLDPSEERAYLSRPERLSDLVGSLKGDDTVVIDEVQKVPALLDVVHKLIEGGRASGRRGGKQGVQFVLTGSSPRKLRRAGVDMLAGRAALLTMHPFMACELGSRFSLSAAVETGTVPVIWSSEDPIAALRAYTALYLREEVQFEGLARRMAAFARFVEAISFSHGSTLNLAHVARECEAPRATVEGYVSILEDLLLATRLPVFSRRAQRQLVDHPKFYWFDAGVFQTFRPRGPLDGPTAGAALEGLVLQHLQAWRGYSGIDARFHYWRTRSGTEVDFVVYGRETFDAIEVTSATRVRPADLSGLRSFHEDYPSARRTLLYRGRERLETEGIRLIPIAEYLGEIVPGKPLP